ncbi:RsiV family protein [Nocardia concava]|uniref:RsiV family protein n=1 Tax=Nocardia concava TaxID=257281 RepID=UPI0002F01C05|nr:RsiV family protein [Nocardia concava]
MRVKSAAVLVLCAASFGLAACNSPDTPAGPVTPTAPVTSTPTGTVMPTTGGKSGEGQDKSTGRFVILSQGHLKGTKGTLSYDIDVPGLGVEGKGVNSEAARAFNSCMWSGAQAFVNTYQQGKSLTDPNARSRVERIGKHVLSGQLWASFDGGGAHPFIVQSTCVINADTTEKLDSKDVFTDENAGLQLLSEQAAKLLPATRAGDGYWKPGITPTAEHYKAWTATPDGMHVYFDQGQVAAEVAGVVDITVPWSALQAQLKPGLRDVLAS